MSTNEKQPSESEAAVAEAQRPDLAGVVRIIRDALPGVVTSAMVIANVVDGLVSGVVLDPAERGGGYISEQELAARATYLLIGVGVESDVSGVVVLDDWQG